MAERRARWREPLLLFLLLGVAGYAVWSALAPKGPASLRIDAATLRALEVRQEELIGRALTEEERARVRENLIDEEVLLREALNRGLQWSDGRVRQRLTRIMRAALTEAQSEPSFAQLQAWFGENSDRYTRSAALSLEQVCFPWGEDVAPAELEAAASALRAGADPDRVGPPSSMMNPRELPRQTRIDLVGLYGPAFADRVEALPVGGEWAGPIESIQGIHFVRVREAHPAERANFEEIESWVRQDWLLETTRQAQQQRIAGLRAGYRIEIAEN